MFNPHDYRSDFPILQRKVHETKPLIYLDNAATSQKPQHVIDAISNYYLNHNANVHRGVHQLGDESTTLFHQSRRQIAEFFGASAEELIIVRNTTEGINQVVYGWAEHALHEGDVILTTELEHHSNLVPWQELARRKSLRILYVPVLVDGRLDQEKFVKIIADEKVAIFACTHVSNTLGTKFPVEDMAAQLKLRRPNAKVLIDGAQAAPHLPINFDKSPFDFYVVSAHKMLGPMGIGAILVKKELIGEFSPIFFGGGMINEVSLETTTFAEDLEDRFTAGTPDVASLVGWAAACKYLNKIGMKSLLEHDHLLVQKTLEVLTRVPEVQVIGITDAAAIEAGERVGSITFLYKNVHAHDVGQILDSEGVAVRTGHHCTMPLHRKFGWPATVRASFQLYNTVEEIEVLAAALNKVKQVFTP